MLSFALTLRFPNAATRYICKKLQNTENTLTSNKDMFKNMYNEISEPQFGGVFWKVLRGIWGGFWRVFGWVFGRFGGMFGGIWGEP